MDYQSDYGPDWVTYTVGKVGPHIITKTVAAPHRPVGPEVTYRLEGTDLIQIDLRLLLQGVGYTRSAATTLADQMDPGGAPRRFREREKKAFVVRQNA